MSVVKRGNSQYYYVQFRLAGRTIIRSARTSNRRAAEQFEIQLRSKIHSTIFLGQKPRIKLQAAFDSFAKSRVGTPNHPNILGHVRSIMAALPNCDLLDSLGAEDVHHFLAIRRAKGIANSTLKHALSVIKGTVDLAKQQGYRVPSLEMPSIKVSNNRLRYLSVEEERWLLVALDPKRDGSGLRRSPNRESELRRYLQDLHDLVVLLLDTGARCSEIRRLKWRDVDLSAGVIHLWRAKVGNESLLFVTERASAVLKRRKTTATSEYVFTNKNGGMRNHPHSSWRKAFNRAGLADCTIHTLRHTLASRLIQNGLTLYDVQTVLGHSDPKTTMRYAHLEKTAVTRKASVVLDELQAKQAISEEIGTPTRSGLRL